MPQTPLDSTRVNEALKAALDINGKWITVNFSDGTSMASSAHTGDATGATAVTVIGINNTLLSGLATGIVKNTTTTGVPSIAVAGDFPTLNQNTTGNAATVTTNANLTGHVTSTGNATLLGSFSSANLAGALSDKTGTGVAVFGTSPVFTAQNLVVTGEQKVILDATYGGVNNHGLKIRESGWGDPYPTWGIVQNNSTAGLAFAYETLTGSSHTFVSPTNILHLATNGIVRMPNYGAGTATFDASGNISSVSDERLKTIQGSFEKGLAEILQVNPILYRWNKESDLEGDNTYTGFSAQNLAKYVPEAVSINPDGYLGISDRAVIATLVNAVKTLSAEIDSLKRRQGLPLTDHSVIANTDVTRLSRTKTVSIQRIPVMQGEEAFEDKEREENGKIIFVSCLKEGYSYDEVKKCYFRNESLAEAESRVNKQIGLIFTKTM